MIKNCSRYSQRITAAKRTLVWVLSLLLVFSVWSWSLPAAHAEEALPEAPSEQPAPSPVPEPEPSGAPEASPDLTPEPVSEPASNPGLMEAAADDGDVMITTANEYDYVVGEVIIKFKSTVSDAMMENTIAAADGDTVDILSQYDLAVAEVPDGETVDSFIAVMEALPGVEYAQPNYMYYLPESEPVLADITPLVGEPLANAPNDPGASLQWYLDRIGVYSAWDYTMGVPEVRVAVIDTGVDYNHPDLSGQVVAYTDIAANDGSMDDDGHGTHVAGIIAAKANNGIGIAGIAPNVKLISVDVFDNYPKEGGGTDFGARTTDVISGISYARNNGARVINLSLGSYNIPTDNAYRLAIEGAVNAGIPVVCAAGNNNTSAAMYPSDFDASISVMATSRYDTRASYSDYGPAKDIAAPGGDGASSDDWMLSTYPEALPDGPYVYMAGTSMAAPVVSGVIALMLSVNPSLTVAQVKEYLYSSAADLGAFGRDDYYGNGRVNAALAVKAVQGFRTSSSIYYIDRRNEFLDKVAVNTTVATLKSRLAHPESELEVYSGSTPITSGIVVTGMTVRWVVGGIEKDRLTIIVRGDVNGDGRITLTDYVLIRLAILNLRGITPASRKAGDIDKNGVINLTDYTSIRLDIMEITKIIP
jgi:subtilisin family serine protease